MEGHTFAQHLVNTHPEPLYAGLESALSIGLLTDNDVVDYVLNYYHKNKLDIVIIESFIRHLIGWRNYAYTIYHRHGKYVRTSNFWGQSEKIYPAIVHAQTQIPFIDIIINKMQIYGTSSPIERKLLGMFLLLCQLTLWLSKC